MQKWSKLNPNRPTNEAPWGKICRNALFSCVGCDVAICSILSAVTDLMTLAYIYLTLWIVKWISDESASMKRGVILCSIFTILVITSIITRNSYIQLGGVMEIKVRKILVSSIYDKVGSLSIKSVTSTNSGKLVTLVSADIFMMERGLAFVPIIFSAPCSNVSVIIAVGITTNWINAAIIFGFLILMFVL